MTPGKARHILARRRTWLLARSEGLSYQKASRDLDEVDALDLVLEMLAPLSRQLSSPAEVAAATERSYVHARQQVAELATRCSCERCPVHGGRK